MQLNSALSTSVLLLFPNLAVSYSAVFGLVLPIFPKMSMDYQSTFLFPKPFLGIHNYMCKLSDNALMLNKGPELGHS